MAFQNRLLSQVHRQVKNLIKISQEEAKKIAFKDANIEESEVSNLKIKEEIENGKSVYDIDFVDLKNKNEVDYQIDAETGKIIERSRDHMND